MKRVLAVIVLSVALLLLPGSVGLAQTSNNASGIEVLPTRAELTISPGKSDVANISVKNITNGEIIAKPEVDDFVADNDSGTPHIITNETETPPNSIKPFISSIPDIPLKSGEQKKIAVTVSIPKNQAAGAYYGVVRFKAIAAVNGQPTDSGQHISLTASVGYIILVQVPGQITERMEAQVLSAELNQKAGHFFLHPPDGMRVTVKNIGNSFLKPFGNVVVKNSKGATIYNYELNATDPPGNVLPNSVRTFHNPIKNIGKFGHYSALASISYGNGGDVLVLKTSFWVVPLWMVIVAGAILLVIALAIFLLVRRLRKHNRKFHKS